MTSIIYIEVETAIRKVSWATAQVGQKSLHRVTVDFDRQRISDQVLTGKTNLLGIELSSIRDDFKLERPRFGPKGKAFFAVSGQTASAVGFLPNINYRFDFEVSPQELTFSGAHDGYPSYNIAVNGASTYDCVQGTLGELLGISDIKVMRRTVALSASGNPVSVGQ